MAGIPVPYLGLKLLTLPTVSDMQQVLKKCVVNERREDVGAGREGRAIALLLRRGRKKEQQSRPGRERISTGSVHRHQLSGLGWGWCKTVASAAGSLLPCSTIWPSRASEGLGGREGGTAEEGPAWGIRPSIGSGYILPFSPQTLPTGCPQESPGELQKQQQLGPHPARGLRSLVWVGSRAAAEFIKSPTGGSSV